MLAAVVMAVQIIVLVALLSLTSISTVCADEKRDTVCTFNLEKRQGHYFFDADFNEARATFMVESGIPALLVDSAFYVQNEKALGLKNMAADSADIRLHNRLYSIAWSGMEEVRIGDAVYSGRVFILGSYDHIAIPVQNLQSGFSDGKEKPSRVVRLDLGSLRIQVLKKAVQGKGMSFPMRMNGDNGMPVVAAQLVVENGEKTATMEGDFIIDLGNPMLLFLMKQNPAVSRMISDNSLELQEAKNPQGVVVAEGLYAERCTLLGGTFDNVSIGVTDKMKTIKEAGLIGLRFFTKPVLLDFDNMELHIEQ